MSLDWRLLGLLGALVLAGYAFGRMHGFRRGYREGLGEGYARLHQARRLEAWVPEVGREARVLLRRLSGGRDFGQARAAYLAAVERNEAGRGSVEDADAALTAMEAAEILERWPEPPRARSNGRAGR